MNKEVSAARIQSLKDREVPSYPDDNSVKAKHSELVVYCFELPGKWRCLVDEHRWQRIVLSVRNAGAPDSDERYHGSDDRPWRKSIRRRQRSILGIDPPIVQH